MRLRELRLSGFRNFEGLELSGFSEGVNLIAGANAQGKTNLIEAVNYVACAKSFRGSADDDVIMRGAAAALIFARYTNGDSRRGTELRLARGRRKAIRIGGLPITRLSQLLGEFNAVVFAPEDMRTIKGSPGGRRRLIDSELSKIKPAYYAALCDYHAALMSKNKLLKQHDCERELISSYNELLSRSAERIVAEREKYISELCGFASRLHLELSGGAEKLSLRYRRCAEGPDVAQALFKRLEGAFARERDMKMCLYGPHREDADILIDGLDAKMGASQGQQRTAMISLKLAVAAVAAARTGRRPVLLLDDVFSELDSSRRAALLGCMEDYQVFITATDAIRLPPGAALFNIKAGNIV